MRKVKVEEIELNITLPKDDIGMVIMQPFIEICLDAEPYRWQNEKKIDNQIDRIIRTLEIAKQANHRCEKTHFTIFPEYSIPGLKGVKKIEEVLRSDSWESGTIVIGGIDGLTKDEYSTLCSEDRTQVHEKNKAEEVRDGQWVDCCITWVKTTSDKGDVIMRWIQPKLCPSWPEENIMVLDMFEGKCVYLFEARVIDERAFRFMSLICYDWIGSLGTANGIFAILQQLNSLPGAKPYGKPVHLGFVLQYNEKPNHSLFLHNAYSFFNNQDYPFVLRDKSIVALINNAGASCPGLCEKYGYSSLVFSPNSPYVSEGSPPSYAVTTKVLRGNSILEGCKEALFRENGGCIHSFRLFHPLFEDRTVEYRRKPLNPVLVYSLEEKTRDPRTPGEQVPAAVKWTNDKIDLIPTLHAPSGQIQTLINNAQDEVKKEIRWCDEQHLKKMIVFATTGMTEEERKNVDIWSEKQKISLESVIYSLTLVSCSNSVTIRSAPAHAYMKRNNTVIDIIVASGGVTHEQNIKHALDSYPWRKERLSLVISRNQQGTPLTDRDKPIYDVETHIKRCGYHNLTSCLTSSKPEELSEIIVRRLGI